jgi:hypothetical protein
MHIRLLILIKHHRYFCTARQNLLGTSMNKFLFPIFILLLLSCSSPRQQTSFQYKGEEAIITKYNASKTNLPLLVVIPDVYGSMLSEEVLKRLAKNYRVTAIGYLGAGNSIRKQQLDNLQNRTTFYSDQLSLLTTLEADSITLLAEGLNANIASGMVHGMRIKKYVMLNPYSPTLRDVLTTKCYSQPSADCDSLIQFMQFGHRFAIDSVFVEISNPSRDNQYGRYTTSYWKDIFPLQSAPQTELYKGSVNYLFTTNSGLAPKTLPKNATLCSKAKLKDCLATLIRN